MISSGGKFYVFDILEPRKMTYWTYEFMTLSFLSYLQQIIWAITERLFLRHLFRLPKLVTGFSFCLDTTLLMITCSITHLIWPYTGGHWNDHFWHVLINHISQSQGRLLRFSYYKLMVFIMLAVILLSLLMILLSSLSVIMLLVCGRVGFWNWIWTKWHCEIGWEVACWCQCCKLDSFDLTVQITVMLLMWIWIGLPLMKIHL